MQSLGQAVPQFLQHNHLHLHLEEKAHAYHEQHQESALLQGGMTDRPAWEAALGACMADIQQQGKATTKLQACADAVRKDARSPEAWQAFLQQVQSAGVRSTAFFGIFQLRAWCTASSFPGVLYLPFVSQV